MAESLVRLRDDVRHVYHVGCWHVPNTPDERPQRVEVRAGTCAQKLRDVQDSAVVQAPCLCEEFRFNLAGLPRRVAPLKERQGTQIIEQGRGCER